MSQDMTPAEKRLWRQILVLYWMLVAVLILGIVRLGWFLWVKVLH